MSESHDRPTDELRDRAQQYVLGTLPEPEQAGFARHLEQGCDVCAAEVRATQELASRLAFDAPAGAPRPELKERLLTRVRGEVAAAAAGRPNGQSAPVQTWKSWAAAGAGQFLRHDEGVFEPTGVKGIAVRRLYVDPQQKSATMLVRMEAGTSYPGHRHGGVEECFVLSGDLHHAQKTAGGETERVMRGGDFEVVTEGSQHGRQWTEEGCLLLIRSSLADELLER